MGSDGYRAGAELVLPRTNTFRLALTSGAEFFALGGPPGGRLCSAANSVINDVFVACGSSDSGGNTGGTFRWTRDDELDGLGKILRAFIRAGSLFRKLVGNFLSICFAHQYISKYSLHVG